MILAAGCSNTSGFELEEEIGYELGQVLSETELAEVKKYRKENNWTQVFGRHFGKEVVNLSAEGSSNEQIIERLITYIETITVKPDLVLVGLSSPDRMYKYFDGTYAKTPLTVSPAHFGDSLQRMFKSESNSDDLFNWYKTEVSYFYNVDFAEHRTVFLVKLFTQYLENKGIDYYIVNTFATNIDLEKITPYSYPVDLNTFSYRGVYPQAKGKHWLSEAHREFGKAALNSYLSLKKKSTLYTYGCSFTQYNWLSYADIIGTTYDHHVNRGDNGSGNRGIYHRLISDLDKFDDSTEVIVQWSSFLREDRILPQEILARANREHYGYNWLGAANMIVQDKIYKQDYLKYFNPVQMVVESVNYIISAYELLKAKKIPFKFTWMLDPRIGDHLGEPFTDESCLPDKEHRPEIEKHLDRLSKFMDGKDEFVDTCMTMFQLEHQDYSVYWRDQPNNEGNIFYDRHLPCNLHLRYAKEVLKPDLEIAPEIQNILDEWDKIITNPNPDLSNLPKWERK